MTPGRARPAARALALLAVLSAAACAAPEAPPVRERPELARHFDAFGARGTFVLLDAATGERTVHDPARARTGFIPASTFKVFNSLVALETGVVGVDDTIPWDGVEREIPVWNQDQRMREAFQRSTVWFYQELARRVGEERMRAALAREGYGNQDTGGGIDQFWLTGAMRISADEQIEFLRRLRNREVGFSADGVAQVEELLLMERCPDYTLRAKSGWGRTEGRHLGWLIGWLERGADVHFFAMNLETDAEDFPMVQARMAITRGVLDELGLPAPGC